MKLINIGYGNMVSAGRVVAIVSPESAPIKRMIQEVRERGGLIDASFGRSTRAVLIMDSGNVILSALTPENLAARIEERTQEEADTEDSDDSSCMRPARASSRTPISSRTRT